MNTRRNRFIVTVTVVVMAVIAAACGGGSSSSSGGSSGGGKPLVIGISLSQSGDFSDPGHAAMLGYQLWADSVNKRGGVLGRKVQLKIVDDASDPNQAVTNYQTLITKDKVDLVFGPFSTLLTAPSARVASRYGYSFLEPAGGGQLVFDQKLHNVFFVQPAPTVNCGDPFVDWLSTLPASQRPKTAAYPTLDDPFATPIVERARAKLEALGVKTVYSQVYPAETADMTPIVAKMVAAKPDLIFGGTQSLDAYGIVNGLVQQHYNPKFLFLSNGANSAAEFPGKVGANNTEGILSCTDWFPELKTPETRSSSRSTSPSTAAPPTRSTAARPRPTRSARCSRRRPRRPARSTTRPSSARCTPACGRLSRATSAGISTARRRVAS